MLTGDGSIRAFLAGVLILLAIIVFASDWLWLVVLGAVAFAAACGLAVGIGQLVRRHRGDYSDTDLWG